MDMHKLHYNNNIKFFIKTNTLNFYFLNTELPTTRTSNFEPGLIRYPLFKICHVFDLAQPIMQQQYIGSRTAAQRPLGRNRLGVCSLDQILGVPLLPFSTSAP